MTDAHLFWDNYRCCGRLSLLRVPFGAITGEYRRRCRHCRRSWVVSLICTQLDPFRIDTILWREQGGDDRRPYRNASTMTTLAATSSANRATNHGSVTAGT